jgi:hypothetical protein
MSDPNRTAEKAAKRQEREARYASYVQDVAAAGVLFQEFPKIPRLNRNITITEKIDGTNAAIHITGRYETSGGQVVAYKVDETNVNDLGVIVPQSRKRILTPEEDNFGFARWVEEHSVALRTTLGPGIHYGEWWGQGIQRGYRQVRKWFSLFNYTRWSNDQAVAMHAGIGLQVVPILYHGPWMAVVGGKGDVYPQRNEDGSVTPGMLRFAPDVALEQLAARGSVAAMVSGITYKKDTPLPGDRGPEGIVVFHETGRLMFKATLENDEQPKTFVQKMDEEFLNDLADTPLDEL